MSAAQIATLTQQFDDVCMDAVQEGRLRGYDPTVYSRMRNQHGPVDTARRLIDESGVPYGFGRLWELNLLKLTLEAIVHDNPKFQALFSQKTLDNCRARLVAVGYI